jgi:histone-lysine N-methyltransferase SETMAR
LLDRFFPGGRDPRQKKLVVHLDNASAHNARVTENFFEHSPPKRLPPSPYSPDISPSDFYRFGKVKSALIGQEIPDEIGLHEAVTEILGGISGHKLQAVFRNWIECIQDVIDADGGYLSS